MNKNGIIQKLLKEGIREAFKEDSLDPDGIGFYRSF
jgi:hypothetical protein